MTPSEQLQANAMEFLNEYFEGFRASLRMHEFSTMTFCEDESWNELWPTTAFTCSVCSKTLASTESDYKFCPFCGARIKRFECSEGDSLPEGWEGVIDAYASD